MRTLVVLALPVVFTACATTGTLEPTDPSGAATGASVKLDFSARTDEARPTFPAVVDPQLPSADRIAPRMRALGAEVVSADIHLCVSPSGRVASASLARGSSYAAFDHAMMRDVADWRFAAMPGPASVKSCEQFTISYRPHR